MNDIIQGARKRGLCDKWYKEMQENTDMSVFCDMYFRGDDWAKEQDFPTLDLLRKYKKDTEPYGLYTDFKGELTNVERVAIFGNSDVVLNYDNFCVAQIIIRHNSNVKIKAKDYSILQITILDDAKIDIEEKDHSKIFLHKE